MIETVTVSRVSATDKKADGTKLKNKFGEFFRVGIQTDEHKDEVGDPVWINGFSTKRPEWTIGEKLQVEITEEEYNGRKQLKFRLPKKETLQDDKIKSLEAEIAKLKGGEKNVEDNF